MTKYSACPMSIEGIAGYGLQRDHQGTVKYWGDSLGIRLFPYAQAERLAERLTELLPVVGPEREWMERPGAHANSKEPIGYRPIVGAKYLLSGRHHKGYPETVVVTDLNESVHILQQVNHTHKANPLRSVSMR